MHIGTRWAAAVALVVALCAPAFGQSSQNRATLSSISCPGTGCVTLSVQGVGGVAIQVTGAFTGTLTFEGSVDGTTFQALTLYPTDSTTGASTTTTTGVWSGGVGGLSIVRVRVSSGSLTGSAVVSLQSAPVSSRAVSSGGGGGGTPAGPVNSIQFNDAGSFGGSSALTWDGSALQVGTGVPAIGYQVGAFISSTDSASVTVAGTSDGYGYGDIGMGFVAQSGDVTPSSNAPATPGTTYQIAEWWGEMNDTTDYLSRDVGLWVNGIGAQFIVNGVGDIGMGNVSPVQNVSPPNLTNANLFIDGATGNTTIKGAAGIGTAASSDSGLNLTKSVNEGFGAWVNATLNGVGWLNAIDLNSGVAAGVAGGTIQALVIEPPTLGAGATLGTFQGIAIGDLSGVTVGSKAEAINYADKFIVDASGTVFQDLGGSLPGTTLLTNQFGPVMAMAIQYDSNEFYGIVQLAGGNNAYGVYNEFVKSRSTDGSTPAAAQAGDTMMYLESRADDGAGGIVEGPRIITEILSAPVVGNLVPSRVVFSVPNADGLTAANAFTLTPTVVTFSALTTTGAATGKKVVCVDTATGQLYASSTGTDCSN